MPKNTKATERADHTTKRVNFTIDIDLLPQLERHAKKTGLKKSRILSMALRSFLKKGVDK